MANSSGKICAWCMREAKEAGRCSRCKQLYYCNRECQTKDWPAHKPHCAPRRTTGPVHVVDSADNQHTLQVEARKWWLINGCPIDGFLLVMHTEDDRPVEFQFLWIKYGSEGYIDQTSRTPSLKKFVEQNMRAPPAEHGLALVTVTPSILRTTVGYILNARQTYEQDILRQRLHDKSIIL